VDFKALKTEQVNPRSVNIDQLSSIEIARVMNEEDATVAHAVQEELPKLAEMIDLAVNVIQQHGRILYIGAGTSGRLGVLDASELPPTFNSPPDQFIGIIAGGPSALQSSKPTVEDDPALGEAALKQYGLSDKDFVIGLTASGSASFVLGALQYARSINARTGIICCNKNTDIGRMVDVAVEIDTGPEIILGSTRLKAGTAQKMALNMFSTGTMIRLGKVYQNYMVDFTTNNTKLYQRAIRIIMETTELSESEAIDAYQRTNGSVKASIILALTGADVERIHDELSKHHGKIREALAALS
jgi:N-acetylmuramic acid 6-phosphate etherase